MALANNANMNDTIRAYSSSINWRASTRLLQQVVNLGLPTLWLYYRALGIENAFFDLLKTSKHDITQIKEILYGIDLVNQAQEFFPRLPAELLKLEIPADVKAAMIVPAKADSLAYVFDDNTLADTLQRIMQSNLMLTIGNHYRAIGLTQSGNKYYLFAVKDDSPREFNDLTVVAKKIMQYIAGSNTIDQQQQALVIQSLNMPNTVHFSSALQVLTNLLQTTKLSDDLLKESLRLAVELGDKQQVQAYIQAKTPLNLTYMGDLNLPYIAWHKTHSANEMFKYLFKLETKFDSTQLSLLAEVLPEKIYHEFMKAYNQYNNNSGNRPSNFRK